MKKIAFMALLIVSCAKEDPEPSNPFIGEWVGYYNSTTSCNSPSSNGGNPCGTSCNSYAFTEDTFVFDTKFVDYEGTYTVKGDSIFMPALSSLGLHKRTFKFDGDKLSLSYQSTQGCVVTNSYQR